jgi:hypothetical protein
MTTCYKHKDRVLCACDKCLMEFIKKAKKSERQQAFNEAIEIVKTSIEKAGCYGIAEWNPEVKKNFIDVELVNEYFKRLTEGAFQALEQARDKEEG